MFNTCIYHWGDLSREVSVNLHQRGGTSAVHSFGVNLHLFFTVCNKTDLYQNGSRRTHIYITSSFVYNLIRCCLL